jgi:predicted nucleotidyltransferase
MTIMTRAVLVVIYVLSAHIVQADWLTELAEAQGAVKQWNAQAADATLNKYIQNDKHTIAQIEMYIKQSKTNGFWASLHSGAYKVELVVAQQQLNYHKKIAQVLKELPENKKQGELLFERLGELNQLHKELLDLKALLEKAEDFTDTLKIGAQVAAKQAEISLKETIIKSSLLLS